jgi:uncharacterized protein YndB with AHSA1/START domain
MTDTNRVENRTRITVEPGRQEMITTREFDAPRELVFRAHTNPEMFAQWVGPSGLTTTIETFEPRFGGRYRFTQRDPQGNEYAFHGVFHEVKEPERITQTFEWEGMPEAGHVTLETVRFEELPENRTRMISHSIFQTVEDRDGMMQDGMEEGMEDSYRRLDNLLDRIRTRR